jgi:hypothetical protein
VSSSRMTSGRSAQPSMPFGRLAASLLLLLLVSLLGQSTLALAISPVEIWNGGIYDDAPQADIPMASSQIAALPCSAAGACVPARVVGTVTGRAEADCVAPLLEVSRSRAPPLA